MGRLYLTCPNRGNLGHYVKETVLVRRSFLTAPVGWAIDRCCYSTKLERFRAFNED